MVNIAIIKTFTIKEHLFNDERRPIPKHCPVLTHLWAGSVQVPLVKPSPIDPSSFAHPEISERWNSKMTNDSCNCNYKTYKYGASIQW